MTVLIPMRVAELILARLCHDLISPIAAINNGVELLGEEDPEFVRDAVALVGDSGRTAGKRLQFYRFAYGFSLGGGALAGPPPHELATEFFDGSKIACDYPDRVRGLSPDWQKLACNLLLVGAEGLPRGGHLRLTAGAFGPDLAASGDGAGLSPELSAATALDAPVGELTSRTVGAHFTALLAGALARRLVVAASGPGRFEISVSAV